MVDYAAPFNMVMKGLEKIGSIRKDITHAFSKNPVYSVAKKARKSIAYYPVIVSDSISTEVLSPLIHFIQARAVIYTRIAITNEDPKNLKKMKKDDLINRFSGKQLESVIGNLGSNVGDSDVENFLIEKIKEEDFEYFQSDPQDMGMLLNDPIHSEAKNTIASKKSNRVEVQDQRMDKMVGLMPSVLNIEIPKGKSGDSISFVIAVKAVAHQVPSMDLRDAIQEAVIEKSFIIKLLRLTSGEISFWKDFLFNLKQVKKDFTGKSGSASGFMSMLHRQTLSKNIHTIKENFKTGVVPPTATIVILSDDVDELRHRTNIDLYKPATIKMLLRKHNFMSFIIVNESLDVVSVFNEGDDKFERITFSDIKKLNSAGRNRGGQMNVEDLFRLMRG